MEVIKFERHGISKTQIDRRALDIVERLQKKGFETYVVGGAIRDLLLGKRPKDFDIATSARPDEIRDIFRNCRLIGKRFRLAHIVFGRDIFEVATFRGNPEMVNVDNLGRILEDNSYGSLKDDAYRRDFTINALYYNPKTEEIIDFHNAFADIENRLIRIIGEPAHRYQEDPVRILRAVRFKAKLNMDLERQTFLKIAECKNFLKNIPQARLLDEAEKLFLSGSAVKTFNTLLEFGVFEILFPDAAGIMAKNDGFANYAKKIINSALLSSDQRVLQGKSTTIAFVFAAIFWPAFQLQYQAFYRQGMLWRDAMYEAVNIVCLAALERISVTARLREMIREIWELQADFDRNSKTHKRRNNLVNKPRFRAGFDFLVIRCEAGEDLGALVRKWAKEYG